MPCPCGSTKCTCEKGCYCQETHCECGKCELLQKICPRCNFPFNDIVQKDDEYDGPVCSCSTFHLEVHSILSSPESGSYPSASAHPTLGHSPSFSSTFPRDENYEPTESSFCCSNKNPDADTPPTEHETSTYTSDHREVSMDRQVRKVHSRKSRTEKSSWQTKKVKGKQQSSNSAEEYSDDEEIRGQEFQDQASKPGYEEESMDQSAAHQGPSGGTEDCNVQNQPGFYDRMRDTSTENLSLLVNTSNPCSPEHARYVKFLSHRQPKETATSNPCSPEHTRYMKFLSYVDPNVTPPNIRPPTATPFLNVPNLTSQPTAPFYNVPNPTNQPATAPFYNVPNPANQPAAAPFYSVPNPTNQPAAAPFYSVPNPTNQPAAPFYNVPNLGQQPAAPFYNVPNLTHQPLPIPDVETLRTIESSRRTLEYGVAYLDLNQTPWDNRSIIVDMDNSRPGRSENPDEANYPKDGPNVRDSNVRRPVDAGPHLHGQDIRPHLPAPFPRLPRPFVFCASGNRYNSNKKPFRGRRTFVIPDEQIPATEKMDRWFGTLQDVINTSGELPDAEAAASLDKREKEENLEQEISDRLEEQELSDEGRKTLRRDDKGLPCESKSDGSKNGKEQDVSTLTTDTERSSTLSNTHKESESD